MSSLFPSKIRYPSADVLMQIFVEHQQWSSYRKLVLQDVLKYSPSYVLVSPPTKAGTKLDKREKKEHLSLPGIFVEGGAEKKRKVSGGGRRAAAMLSTMNRLAIFYSTSERIRPHYKQVSSNTQFQKFSCVHTRTRFASPAWAD